MRKSIIKYFQINVAIFAIITLWGLFAMGDELNYRTLSFYIIIPLATMICSFLAYDGNKFNIIMYIVLVTILGYLIPGIVFNSWGASLLKFTYTLFPSICGMITRHIVIKNSH